MIPKEKLSNHQNSKVAKLGFLKEKSTELWPSITFTCFIRFSSTKKAYLEGNWASNASSEFHGSSKNPHIKFQALHHKFAQSIAQMSKNQLYWVKSQLWSTYSQTARFLVNINILKVYSSFDQGFIMIHQEKLSNRQKSKVAKLGFLKEK